MKKRSFKLIQRTASTLAALVFALVAGVSALSESKKVKAEDNSYIFVDTYYSNYENTLSFYSFDFVIYDEENIDILSNYGYIDDLTQESIYIGNGDSGYYNSNMPYYAFGVYSDCYFNFDSDYSLKKSYYYNVSLSDSANSFFDDADFNSLKFTRIDYTFTNNENQCTFEVYILYSDYTKQYIEQQQAAENALQENENLKKSGAIMIIVIISMVVGFCVLLFTRSR